MDTHICVILKSTSLKFSARFIDVKISIRQLHLAIYNSPGSLTDFARDPCSPTGWTLLYLLEHPFCKSSQTTQVPSMSSTSITSTVRCSEGRFTSRTNNSKERSHSLTCGQTLAGIPGWRRADPVGRGRDLVPAVLDADRVAARLVRDVGDRVSAILVVMDVHSLGFALLVLSNANQKI